MIARYFAGASTEEALATVVVYGVVALLALFCGVVLIPEIARDTLDWMREALGPKKPDNVVDIESRRKVS